MAYSKQTSREAAFPETAKAIEYIKDSSLRRDFGEVLRGAEYGVSNCKAHIANECVGVLKGMTFYLCRTISGPTARAIFDGLVADVGRSDGKVSAMMLPPGDIKWGKDKWCPGGGAACATKKRYSCLDDGGSGCTSKGPSNKLSAYTGWGVALLHEDEEVAADFLPPDDEEVATS